MSPRVSVVVPNWNGMAHLAECFDALRAQSYSDFEIIFVDNASTDDSVDWVRQNVPKARVIQRARNDGFAPMVNDGIRASDADYIALLNNDTRVDEDWLHELITALEQRREYDSAASRMMLYYERDKLNAAGDVYRISVMAGVNRGLMEPVAGYQRLERVLGACAGAALYRSSFFRDVGLFDEDFFLIAEDTDINIRALIAGKRCLYVPDAVVWHKLRASIGGRPHEIIARLQDRNEAIVFAKGMPWPLLLLWPLIWIYRDLRKTFPVRPSLWPQIPSLVAALPRRVRAEVTGFRMGWRKRPEVWAKKRVSTLHIIRWLVKGTGPV